MAFVADVVTEDKRFRKRKFDTIEMHGQSEDLSVGSLMKKWRNIDLSYADADYITYLKGHIFIPCDPQHQFSVEDGDDPQYTLFLSRLKKDRSSYILEADKRIGLTKPLKYEEDEFDGLGQEDMNGPSNVGQEDMNSPSETQLTEEVDLDYAFFCNNLRFNGSNLIFQHDSGQSTVYDGKDQPNFQMDNGAYSRKQMPMLSLRKEKSIYSSEEDSYDQHGKQKRKTCSKFRVRILKILSQPYDQEEHQKLLHDITVKKPQHKHIDLRSGSARFIESNKMGKSYLEHHGDLKRKVSAAAKDDCKQLNLLRGFFFWLQNLTQEGSFIPWNDEECLAVWPEAC